MAKSRIPPPIPWWFSTKPQPRLLGRRPTPQPCCWPECSTQATSTIADQTYCAAHLLQIMHEQWKE
jgi:hypothetical protein